MRLVTDLESNGLLETMDVIHCICAIDRDTQKRYSWKPWQIDEAIDVLQEADELIFHNGVGFDVQAIKKLYPNFKPKKVTDTLILAKIAFGDGNGTKLEKIDFGLSKKGKLPANLIGSHKLEAYGFRMGILKGTYGHDTEGAWEVWSPEMQSYCEQDVEVTLALIEKLESRYLELKENSTAIELEHEVSYILDVHQRVKGMKFNSESAEEVKEVCERGHAHLVEKFNMIMPPFYTANKVKGEVVIKTPARRSTLKGANGLTFSTEPGAPYTELKLNTFTGTDADIINLLTKVYDWEPTEFTDTGLPKVGAEFIENLPYDCIDDILDMKILKKVQGYVSSGKNAWLKLVDDDGMIRHRCMHIGAATHRTAHSSPNLGQIPAARGSDLKIELGHKCRAMFGPPKGYSQVGVDLSGIELRMLAHYLYRFDGGRYADIVTDGDVHWATVLALGLYPPGTKRDKNNVEHENARGNIAKVFAYAYMYGAGPGKIMKILGVKTLKEAKKRMDMFAKALGLNKLKDALEAAVAEHEGFYLLDGRKVFCSSPHKALNFLLQGSSAVVFKRWIIICHKRLKEAGYREYIDFHQLCCTHDEIQMAVRDGIDVSHIEKIMLDAITETASFYKMNVRLDGEAKHGDNWSACH